MSATSSWPRRMFSGAAKLFAAGTLIAAAATAFGAVSARQFQVRYQTVPLLPVGHQPFRVLHVGDMHLVHRDRGKIDFVRELAATQPDLVINTGDNPGGVNAIDDVLEALTPLLKITGVFVPGSNDFYGPRPANPLRYLRAPTTIESPDELRDTIDVSTMFGAFSAAGWHRLGNRALTLKVRDDLTINFAGTHDAHMQADAWPGFTDTRPAAEVNIAVTHAPYRRVLDAAVADGADLIFAGHTHGGQVALPRYGAIVANCDLPTGLASGLFSWRSAGSTGLVNVTSGVGTSPTVPLRTFCPPEAVVVDLVASDAGTTIYPTN